jgi:hypothetical protein
MAMHRTSRPWLLIVVLIFGAAAAMATVPLQVAALKQGGIASAGDVARNGEVLERLERLEELSAEDVAEHRVANQRDHDCLIALALLLADPERDRTVRIVDPCPERNENGHLHDD